MDENKIHIRVNDEFRKKVDYLMKIYGFKDVSKTIRWIVEKEYEKEKIADENH